MIRFVLVLVFVVVLVLESGVVARLIEHWSRRLGYHLISPESLLSERFTPKYAHHAHTPNASRHPPLRATRPVV